MEQIKSKKVLVRFGLGFGIGIVVIGAFLGLEFSWLTSGERVAAQQALVAIDNLQSFGLDDDDSDARLQQAEDAVEAARRAVQTQRDQSVAFALMQYLGTIEVDRERMRAQGITQDQIEPAAARESESAAISHMASSTTSHSLSLKLHETLD